MLFHINSCIKPIKHKDMIKQHNNNNFTAFKDCFYTFPVDKY